MKSVILERRFFGKDCGLASRAVGYRCPVIEGDEADFSAGWLRSTKLTFSSFNMCFILSSSTIISDKQYSIKCGVFSGGLESPASPVKCLKLHGLKWTYPGNSFKIKHAWPNYARKITEGQLLVCKNINMGFQVNLSRQEWPTYNFIF